MLVSLSDYGKIHGKSGDTLRRMAEKGVLTTAYKIGRNWVVDSEEEYPLQKRKNRTSNLAIPGQTQVELDIPNKISSSAEGKKHIRYSNETVEKSNGIVYTPSDLATYVANQMVENYCYDKDKFYVLDPAIGDGELIIALLNTLKNRFRNPDVVVVGYETDSDVINRTRQRITECYSNVQVLIENKNFLNLLSDGNNKKYDFIIANPPYIRTQILGAAKAQEIASLVGLDGRVDIYYAFLVYAEQMLNNDGIAGFITSNKFMTIKAGQTVRKHLVSNTDILRLTDFGDTKLFSASVLPCVIIFRKRQNPVETVHTSIYESKDCIPERFFDSIFDGLDSSKTIGLHDGRKFNIINGTLHADHHGSPWRINTISHNSWLEKIEKNTKKRFCDLGKIRVGIKTTADNVFIRESWKQEEYIPELLKSLITHRNAGQISSDNNAFWQVLYTHTIINGKKTAYDIEEYPNACRYLSMHREQLESRTYIKKANRNWYEIWVPQNPEAWGNRKIVFRDIADVPQFWLDETGAVVNGDCYWFDIFDDISEDEIMLALAVANSKFIEQYYDICFNNKLYSGRRRFMTQYVEQFPLPDCESKDAQDAIHAVKEILRNSMTQQQKKHLLEAINILVYRLFVN
ncbi:MAG: Modification methylase PaeR7I [Syntrophomonadaceae bacterium]|nr:Modification methylase PaeR7I [Bacillota bacterium]